MRSFPFFLLICLILFISISCQENTIKIGLLSSFSGSDGDMGRDALNGAILVADRINSKGGIRGKKLKLLAHDDKGTPEGAAKGTQNLVDSGVEIIIGPFLSNQVEKALEICEREKVLLFSPTAASSFFKGKDDMLLRLNFTAEDSAKIYAERIINKYKIKKAGILYDLGNAGYTKGWTKSFSESYIKSGGKIVAEATFNSFKSPALSVIAENVLKNNPEAIIIVANSFYTASISQQLRKSNPSIALFASEWASLSFNELSSIGGPLINGMEILTSFNPNSEDPEYLKFKEIYNARFKKVPGPAGFGAYETARVIIQGFLSQKKNQSIKEAIIEGGPYQGMLEEISFDKFGDNIIDPSFYVLINGKLQRVFE